MFFLCLEAEDGPRMCITQSVQAQERHGAARLLALALWSWRGNGGPRSALNLARDGPRRMSGQEARKEKMCLKDCRVTQVGGALKHGFARNHREDGNKDFMLEVVLQSCQTYHLIYE